MCWCRLRNVSIRVGGTVGVDVGGVPTVGDTVGGNPTVGGTVGDVPTVGGAVGGVPTVGSAVGGVPAVGGAVEGVPAVGSAVGGVPTVGGTVYKQGTRHITNKALATHFRGPTPDILTPYRWLLFHPLYLPCRTSSCPHLTVALERRPRILRPRRAGGGSWGRGRVVELGLGEGPRAGGGCWGWERVLKLGLGTKKET